MSPYEESRLKALRAILSRNRVELPSATKQRIAGESIDEQLELVVGPSLPEERRQSVDRVAVRAVLLAWSVREVEGRNRQKRGDGTGRIAEEVRTADGTKPPPWEELTLFEADQVIDRKLKQAAGVEFEADYLQALRDLAAERARNVGLDPDVDEIVIGDYVEVSEAKQIRDDLAGQVAA